jgi:hypothetical protein
MKLPFDLAALDSKLPPTIRRGFIDADRRTATPHVVQQNGLCEDMLGQSRYYEEREGHYRITRLAAQHGETIQLDDLLDALVVCKWRRPGTMRRPAKYDPKCAAGFEPDPCRIP